jgi:hypothetical protein
MGEWLTTNSQPREKKQATSSAENAGPFSPKRMNVPMELTKMIGTTRSRVSLFMNKFRKLGFIDYNGELHVHSSLLNVVLHD